ncbi:hypothetical protein FDI59_gp097 [Mycobacterium phage Yoshi]|uniref:Uncharacterized protein n=1 Tax=Mycobacterium phage Yoshi TaxID=2920891 RepID=G1BSK4_9CAUD|nr:hypothetical protein FDI59_gp097 [Mycobacterium phage Yoshi]AEK07844.1 hypothetical protein YOSHI_97 [Mycobacterium phage Yoshi]
MSDVVERAKAALEGAYEGPWVQVGGGNINVDPVGHRPPVAKTWTRGNGEFIAQARTLVPELVAEVERLRAQETRIRELCERAMALHDPWADDWKGDRVVRADAILAALDTEEEA